MHLFKIKYLFLLLFFTIQSFSQEKMDANLLLTKVEKFYQKKKEYKYNTYYRLFENSNSKKVIEKKQGVTLYKNNVNYQIFDNTESIVFKDYNVVINHNQKVFQISKSIQNNSLLNIEYLLKAFPNKKIIANKDFWICELMLEKGSVSQYEKIHLYIDMSNFSIKKQILFFYVNQQLKQGNQLVQLKKPRLEITLEEIKITSEDLKKVNSENYFKIQNNKISLSKRFQKYKLITL